MKIDGLFGPTSGSGSLSESKGQRGNTRSASESNGVHLSSLSSKLQALEKRLGSADPVDAAHVAEIKQAIADGRFRVNPEAVAERLLEAVRELLHAQTKPGAL